MSDLATGSQKQLPPAQANELVGQLYQDVVDKAGADSPEALIMDPSQISGSLMPVNVGPPFPTAGQHLCFPVSEFQTSRFASGFGTFAERLIEDDCSPTITYVANNNATAYRAFLVAHNPSLASGPGAAKLAGWFSNVSRPDIRCDDGVQKDYYEIKGVLPLRFDGRNDQTGQDRRICIRRRRSMIRA